jgi:probable HAF family extracellular repeat protein
MIDLGVLPSTQNCYAQGMSADGTVIIGYCSADDGRTRAFRWTASGMSDLGTLEPASSSTSADAVSANGSVVVGESTVDGVAQGFRWTLGRGMVAFGTAANGGSLAPAATNADGSVVVFGRGGTGGLWTEALGAVSLQELLPPDAVPDGWRALSASSVSTDGLVVVGSGFNAELLQQAWRVTLAPECL